MDFQYRIPPTWQRIATHDSDRLSRTGPFVFTFVHQHKVLASPRLLQAHAQANFLICYVVSGDGRWTSEGSDQPIATGDILVTPAGYVHAIEATSDCLQLFFVEVLESHRTLFYEQRRVFRYYGKLMDVKLKESLHWLIDWFMTPSFKARLEQEARRSLSLAELELGSQTTANDWTDAIRLRLHDGYREQFELVSLAKELDLNPAHVTRRFRERFGITIGTYLRRLRLSLALGMIIETDSPFSLIAIDSGFSDQAHLTRMCRSLLGYSPTEIRKRFRSELQSQNNS